MEEENGCMGCLVWLGIVILVRVFIIYARGDMG